MRALFSRFLADDRGALRTEQAVLEDEVIGRDQRLPGFARHMGLPLFGGSQLGDRFH